jgi:hypothetical protein
LQQQLTIQSYCHIKNNQLWLNGKLIFEGEQKSNIKDFLKSCYKDQKIHYPKFFKMDNMSKLSILAAELILSKIDLDAFDHNIALIFSNKAASLDTDRKHQKSIDKEDHYYPSPAIFVYTLPNIGIGEISIKHKLNSENGFFIFEDFNAKFHHNYEQLLIKSKKSNAVLAGWVDVDDENYEAFVYLVSNKGSIKHTEQNLIKLYKE